jgi:hypothetical protein
LVAKNVQISLSSVWVRTRRGPNPCARDRATGQVNFWPTFSSLLFFVPIGKKTFSSFIYFGLDVGIRSVSSDVVTVTYRVGVQFLPYSRILCSGT